MTEFFSLLNNLPTTVRNKKTGGLYQSITTVTNCTNAQNGQIMVVYHPLNDSESVYVREIKEFAEKFEPITSD